MVEYRISWVRPYDRLLDVTLSFAAPADTPRLLLPAWRPGRYLLQDYAANVREWSGSHPVWKDGKTSWRVGARAGEAVQVRYRYYAGVLDAGSSFLDDDEAYVNGSNLFMLVEGLRAAPHRLSVAAPADWQIETQMARAGETFVARDYDHLIDSPFIAAGSLTRHTFEERGAKIHLIFRGDRGIDTGQFVEPTRAIVRAQAALFGGLPFREYRFLMHVADKWHGVEHEDSSSIVVQRSALAGCGPGDGGYDHTLSIISHELFHVWNVKRIVPARFSPYDYWQETPTRLLWVMEGLTSYYGELSLVRSGVWSPSRYLVHLQKEIETLEAAPARLHLSLSQASFDGWLANPAHQHDAGNASYSFYNKGEIVSALLDLTIRRATSGSRSLDDVVRLLWEEHGKSGRGLEEDGFERLVREVADVGDFFERYVDGVDPLPYDELLSTAGITFAAALRGDEPSLAAKVASADGVLTVRSVFRGGAGMEAGLLPGDEIVSVGGARTASEAALADAVSSMRDGAEIVIARGGMVRRLQLEPRPDPRPQIRLEMAAESPAGREWLRRIE